MGTLIRRLVGFSAAAILTAGLAACGADATSPSSTESNTASNGTTITVDSVVNNQTAVAGSTIQVFVRVKTASGAAISGDTVTWNVATGGGSVPSKTGVTDANGIATTAWTLGTAAGANSLGATITGAAVPISATGTVGTLTLVTKVSPDSQTVTATGSVLLTVKTTDANGNPIANVNVAWTTTGGTISPTTAVSGTAGNSSVNFTTLAIVSRYTVTATAPGLAPVSFIVKTF
ncbi:MAG: Ig-like domain-containing protein [Gemmatimonadaceae bacterium]